MVGGLVRHSSELGNRIMHCRRDRSLEYGTMAALWTLLVALGILWFVRNPGLMAVLTGGLV